MLCDDCSVLSRLPEHFILSLWPLLESAEQLMALCALKQNLAWAQNDTTRSLNWYQAIANQGTE